MSSRRYVSRQRSSCSSFGDLLHLDSSPAPTAPNLCIIICFQSSNPHPQLRVDDIASFIGACLRVAGCSYLRSDFVRRHTYLMVPRSRLGAPNHGSSFKA